MNSRLFRFLSFISILSMGTAVYSNSFLCSFHFDDKYFILDDLAIRHIDHIQRIWNVFPCRLITLVSFALNYHFHQLNVIDFHVTNLIIHLLTALLVWWLTLLTFSTPAMKDTENTFTTNLLALLAGLVFVCHPIQTEAVTYIWERAASLATMFYLAALCFYIQFRVNPHLPSSRIFYGGAILSTVLAMFTKEISITLPLMILLYEWTFLKKPQEKLQWKYLTPFLTTIIVIPITILITELYRIREILGYHKGVSVITQGQYLLTQLRVMLTYIRLAFVPLNQNFSYDYPFFRSILDLPVMISIIFLTIIFVYAIRLYSRFRLVSFSIFWFFLALMPESSFLPLDDFIFEHRLYLPMVGFSLFLVSSLYYLIGRSNIKIMVLALIGVITWYGLLTYQRNLVWRDELTLWDDAVYKSPLKPRVYLNRGAAYFNKGRFNEAMQDYNRAIALKPDFAKGYLNRASIFDMFKQDDQALFNYNKAIELDPTLGASFLLRGNFYHEHDQFLKAIKDYSKAIDVNPQLVDAYLHRAAAYFDLKEFDRAWKDVNQVQKMGGAIWPGLMSDLNKELGTKIVAGRTIQRN